MSCRAAAVGRKVCGREAAAGGNWGSIPAAAYSRCWESSAAAVAEETAGERPDSSASVADGRREDAAVRAGDAVRWGRRGTQETLSDGADTALRRRCQMGQTRHSGDTVRWGRRGTQETLSDGADAALRRHCQMG